MRPTQHWLDSAGVELNYAEGGSSGGSPLVLLHGLAARWQAFGPLLPALLQEWHVFAPDLRGHGQSGRAREGYRLEDFAQDVRVLLKERVDAPAVLYGHSLGGWVALWLGAFDPERVRGVVLGDTAIYPEGIDPDYAVSYLADLPITMRSLAKSLRELDPAVMEAFRDGTMLDGYDPDALLRLVACPVLLLQADPAEDGLMSDEDVRRALELLPRARHARFDGVGHALGLGGGHGAAAGAELGGYGGGALRRGAFSGHAFSCAGRATAVGRTGSAIGSGAFGVCWVWRSRSNSWRRAAS